MNTHPNVPYEVVKELRLQRVKAFCEECFADREEITLEIGCGHGHYLSAYAAAHPDEYCVGIDLISKRVEKANRKLEVLGVDNGIFFKADAVEFLQFLPKHVVVRRLFLLFLDPWPKKRHHKNRIVQLPFLEQLREWMPMEAEIFFRTDHQEYFAWTVEKLGESPYWDLDASVDWPFEQESYFQKIMGAYQSLVARRGQ